MSVEYFDQLLSAARQVHVVYLAQLLGAVLLIHFISNHDISTKEIVLRVHWLNYWNTSCNKGTSGFTSYFIDQDTINVIGLNTLHI